MLLGRRSPAFSEKPGFFSGEKLLAACLPIRPADFVHRWNEPNSIARGLTRRLEHVVPRVDPVNRRAVLPAQEVHALGLLGRLAAFADCGPICGRDVDRGRRAGRARPASG